jgi:hypothetical protein
MVQGERYTATTLGAKSLRAEAFACNSRRVILVKRQMLELRFDQGGCAGAAVEGLRCGWSISGMATKEFSVTKVRRLGAKLSLDLHAARTLPES